MGVKTRRPYLLSDADFDTFNYVDMKKFLAGPNSLPHRPDHLVPQQATLADAFHAKHDEYKAACDVRDNATSAFAEAAKAIREKLRWIQMALPGLTPGSDEILVPFGLDHDVPADNDEMKNYADAVNAHWQTVRAQAIYAPFRANIDALAALFPSYVAAQSNQVDAQQAAALLQNEKEDLRKQLEDVLAALIDWYRIYYKDPQDEYWTQTPWGKSSGEGGEEPQPGSWEDAPTNFEVREGLPGSALLTADVHLEAEGCAVFMAETDMGVAEPPMRPGEPIAPLITPIEPGKFSYNLNITPNRRVWFWICHIKDAAWGAMAGPEWIEVVK